jgi:hypothetical protein
MITASDVFDDVLSFLDDDSSDRYDEAKDLVPAINNAVLYLVSLFNTAFDQKKLTPEILRELVSVAILPVTGTTTKKADVSSLSMWTLFGVEPDPVKQTITPTPPAVAYDVLVESRNRFATRQTLAAWNDTLSDPFSAGTLVSIPAEFIRAGYIGPGMYCGDSKPYIMIRPAAAFTADFVAIWYLKNPTVVTSGSTSIEFPRSLHNLLVEKTLNLLSLQHGPESTLDKITDKAVTQLVGLMIS